MTVMETTTCFGLYWPSLGCLWNLRASYMHARAFIQQSKFGLVSSDQCFWLQIQRSRVRSPALPDFVSSSGSGTGSTQPRQPREVN